MFVGCHYCLQDSENRPASGFHHPGPSAPARCPPPPLRASPHNNPPRSVAPSPTSIPLQRPRPARVPPPPGLAAPPCSPQLPVSSKLAERGESGSHYSPALSPAPPPSPQASKEFAGEQVLFPALRSTTPHRLRPPRPTLRCVPAPSPAPAPPPHA